MDNLPSFFPTPEHFRAWLQEYHASKDVLWVGYYKKATGKTSITWEESVREALCFGWIDGVRYSIDDASYKIRFSPRQPRSVWSRKNIDMVKSLLAEDRMTPAGLEAYANRQVHPDSGYRVSEYDYELSEDMVNRFMQASEAWAFFESQPPGYRRNAKAWVMSAKRSETRQRRLSVLIDDAANGLRIKQFRRKK